MSKAKTFVRNHLLKKALNGYCPNFRYGERLQMYKNIYKVLHSQDKGFTLLEDEKNSKIAFPTNKLRMLMKRNLCSNLGMLNTISCDDAQPAIQPDVAKATRLSGPSAKVGVSPKAVNAAYAKQSSSSSIKQRGEPVGTVRNGADGDTYKKISANPSVWVRVSTGTVHHDAGGEEQHPLSVSQQSQQTFHSMMSKIDPKVHPEDRERIQKKVEEWIKENAKVKHMQAAHNTNEVDHTGQSLPKTGIPEATMNRVSTQSDKARKVRQELIDMIKESHRKVKGGSGAK